MPKTQLQLLPTSVRTQDAATVAHSDREVSFSIGPRAVSWHHAACRPGPTFGAELTAYTVDVARATAAATVDAMLSSLWATMPPCDTEEVAQLEVARAVDALLAVVDESRELTAPARAVVTATAACEVAAALLRVKAVRW
jgi:hypothetical protein